MISNLLEKPHEDRRLPTFSVSNLFRYFSLEGNLLVINNILV